MQSSLMEVIMLGMFLLALITYTKHSGTFVHIQGKPLPKRIASTCPRHSSIYFCELQKERQYKTRCASSVLPFSD
ncbi:hypothetical protein J2TS4_57740 [Paenibacillus sp. J2TS4]|nr:hypothetical protein J2TS4_57740 [Paenibacillus sp. J2TS4]